MRIHVLLVNQDGYGDTCLHFKAFEEAKDGRREPYQPSALAMTELIF